VLRVFNRLSVFAIDPAVAAALLWSSVRLAGSPTMGRRTMGPMVVLNKTRALGSVHVACL